MIYRVIVAFSLVMAGISGANAALNIHEAFPLDAKSTEQFREQAATLRREMDRGKYSGLSNSDKKTIDQRLDELDALYVRHDTGAKGAKRDWAPAVNAGSEINSLLTRNLEDRLFCEQVKRVGSNRSTKVCMTMADRREETRRAQKFIQDRDLPGYLNLDPTEDPKILENDL